jgi:hypothetical protein
MRRLLILVLIVLAGCSAPKPEITAVRSTASAIPKTSVRESHERFLPVGSESSERGVPWASFFALDTESGQLCHTTEHRFGNEFDLLPSCLALKETLSPKENAEVERLVKKYSTKAENPH